jgi:pyridoxal phosphate enzyme (YggS family)
MIGHLQSNKVKYMSPYVFMVQSVDSLKLLREINKQGERAHRVIDCLLQMHIATEETKFGLNESELTALVQSAEVANMRYVRICGLMGMASFTDNQLQIAKEFAGLRQIFERVKATTGGPRFEMRELSMGMSSDYQIALNEGSTMVRIGSKLFGARR